MLIGDITSIRVELGYNVIFIYYLLFIYYIFIVYIYTYL
jgi:hypothetical protein